MRTLGRRMHARSRLEFSVSARPARRLEAMNLGEVVPLTESEARVFQCRDVQGRVLDGVYAAPAASSGDAVAAGNRMVAFCKRSLVAATPAWSGGAVSDRCVADAFAERTFDVGPHGACAK